MKYLESLNWRYAVKRMNGEKIPSDKLNNILEAISLAPSSMGLQPFHVTVIEDGELRKKLHPAIYNQPQVVEGAAVLVFSAWNSFTEAQVNDYMQNVASTRNQKMEDLKGFHDMLLNIIKSRSQEDLKQWAARQAYIAMGVGITAAAMERVDSTPMEGFIPEKVDEILGLTEKGLHSVVILTLGYRDESTDYLANAKKVRRSKDQFFTHYVSEFA